MTARRVLAHEKQYTLIRMGHPTKRIAVAAFVLRHLFIDYGRA